MKSVQILICLTFFLLTGCFRHLPQVKSQDCIPGEKDYVVLLHGLGRTHRSMSKMEKYLNGLGYQVINYRYDSTKEPIEKLSNDWLQNVLDRYCTQKDHKVNFITHSLGGILVRHYLQENKIPNMGRMVMLSPPNQGSALAQKLKDKSLFKSSMGPAFQQLGNDEDSVPMSLNPIGAEVGIIAGDRSKNWIFSLMIPGPDDGKVSVEEAKLLEMVDFLVLPLNHTEIMENQVAIEQAAYFLNNGKFLKRAQNKSSE